MEKALCSRSIREQKNLKREISRRKLREISRKFPKTFFFSTRFRGETPRKLLETLRELTPRNFAKYSAKARSHLKKRKKKKKKKNVNSLIFCFVGVVVLRPSQQLWSCQDGQLT